MDSDAPMNCVFCLLRAALVILPALAPYSFAQSPDILTLENGNRLIGRVLATVCAGSIPEQTITFQPVDLQATTQPFSKIASIEIGGFFLVKSNTTTAPTVDQESSLKAFLHGAPRPPSPGRATTVSLALTLQRICDPPPESKPRFTGQLKIDGTATFAAQVQRSISATVLAALDPAKNAPGSVTPVIEFYTSYGETTKGNVTSKTSQVDNGRLTLQVRLHNGGSTFGSTNLNVIANEYHNFSQGVSLQQGYGAGVSQNLGGSLRVEGDIWGLRESLYKPAPAFSSGAARFYETDTIETSRFVLTEDLEAILPFKSLHSMLLRGGGSLSIKLGKAPVQPFSITLSYTDFYFRNSPKGYKQNYAQLALGVGYKW